MEIVFRVDGSFLLGRGHIVRCLTLAKVLQERGAKCSFLCRPLFGNVGDLIREASFPLIELPALPENSSTRESKCKSLRHEVEMLGQIWEADAADSMSAIGDREVDWLVVDHYSLDHRWESKMRRPSQKILIIDDLADRSHDCNLLLDQNCVADLESRYDDLVPKTCRNLLGPQYALLQAEYALSRANSSAKEGKVTRVLVYFGGGDATNLTGMTISAIQKLGLSKLNVDVVVNSSSKFLSEVREQLKSSPLFHLHTDLSSLAELMSRADLAIGAAGTTTWERLCLGLPSLVVSLTENQIPIAHELHCRGMIKWLGKKEMVTQSQLRSALNDVLGGHLDAEWSTSCRGVVDGLGAQRVADLLLPSEATGMTIREATMADEKVLLQWANDLGTRKNSLNSDLITSRVHADWFRNQIGNPEKFRIYILNTENKVPIGMIRFNWTSESWYVHYSLDACVRGLRLGKVLLERGIIALRSDVAVSSISGVVKEENSASRRVFERLRFSMKVQENRKLVYSRLFESGDIL